MDSVQARIERLLDQYEDPSTSQLEQEELSRKIQFLQSLQHK